MLCAARLVRPLQVAIVTNIAAHSSRRRSDAMQLAESLALTVPPIDDSPVHRVHFNRGAAGSQAYTRRFGTGPPSEEARQWLAAGYIFSFYHCFVVLCFIFFIISYFILFLLFFF